MYYSTEVLVWNYVDIVQYGGTVLAVEAVIVVIAVVVVVVVVVVVPV